MLFIFIRCGCCCCCCSCSCFCCSCCSIAVVALIVLVAVTAIAVVDLRHDGVETKKKAGGGLGGRSTSFQGVRRIFVAAVRLVLVVGFVAAYIWHVFIARLCTLFVVFRQENLCSAPPCGLCIAFALLLIVTIGGGTVGCILLIATEATKTRKPRSHRSHSSQKPRTQKKQEKSKHIIPPKNAPFLLKPLWLDSEWPQFFIKSVFLTFF